MNELQIVEEKTLLDYIGGFRDIDQKTKTEFLNIAKAMNLNPFKREIYLVPFGNKFNIVTGYQVYIQRGEETGKLDGWKTEFRKEDGDTVCKITIYRKDWKYPFEHETYLSEVKQSSPIWNKQEKFMHRKTTIGQGFRICFPTEMAGLPYEESEIGEKEINPEIRESTLKKIISSKVEKIENPELEKFLTEFLGAVNLVYSIEELDKVKEFYKDEHKTRFGKMDLQTAEKMKEIYENKKNLFTGEVVA